jgi:hypothetical protein
MEEIANDLSWMEETLAWAMGSVTVSPERVNEIPLL